MKDIMKKTLLVDVWSDVACPWCYVGKRRLEGALARFAHKDDVRVTWHAFELDPSAPRKRPPGMSHAERIAKKYGMPLAKAEAASQHLVEVAAADGIEMRFDRIQSGNTFDAHRLIHLAGERGVQDAVKERLLLGYFTEGESMGDPEVLVRLASEGGLDAREARALLASDRLTDEVREDERQAAELGIHGVPFFVIAGRFGLSGAQPVEVLLDALNQGWDATKPPVSNEAVTNEGAVCGPDGCA
jgi:predicted DsbA family dithiol-disulfide isomerase